jgi:hypothetical protein
MARNLFLWLMERAKLEFNLDRKTYVEVQQAKYNKWINIVVFLIVTFFIFLFAIGPYDSKIRTTVLVILIFINLRMVVRLNQYQQRINESRQRQENWKRKTSRQQQL